MQEQHREPVVAIAHGLTVHFEHVAKLDVPFGALRADKQDVRPQVPMLLVGLNGRPSRVEATRAQQVLPRVYAGASQLGQPIVQTRVSPVTLDDVFLELTGKELRD